MSIEWWRSYARGIQDERAHDPADAHDGDAYQHNPCGYGVRADLEATSRINRHLSTPSRSACRTQIRSVSDVQPIFEAIESMVTHCEAYSLSCS